MPTPWQGMNKQDYPKLISDIATDVLIVGGGITGIICAYLLNKIGKKVTVLEADTLGSYATIDTTAFITQALDTDFSQLVEMFGQETAQLIWESGGAAIDHLEQMINEEKIDCEFMRCPAYIIAENENEFLNLRREHESLKKIRINSELRHDKLKLINQAKFHPTKFLYQLAEIASKNGVQIFEHTEALKVSSSKLSVETKNGNVTAEKLIVATYQPFNNPKATHFKKGMYRSYAFEVDIPKDQFEEALYWNQHNPYHYFRIDRGNGFDRMIVGGEDHRSEIKMDRERNFKALEDYLKKILTDRKYEIIKKWSGPILEPSDGLALIGEYTANQFVATAFSGNGMTYAMIAGLMACDWIQGKANSWQKIYDPKRSLKLSAIWQKGFDYVGEFFGGAVRNFFKY